MISLSRKGLLAVTCGFGQCLSKAPVIAVFRSWIWVSTFCSHGATSVLHSSARSPSWLLILSRLKVCLRFVVRIWWLRQSRSHTISNPTARWSPSCPKSIWRITCEKVHAWSRSKGTAIKSILWECCPSGVVQVGCSPSCMLLVDGKHKESSARKSSIRGVFSDCTSSCSKTCWWSQGPLLALKSPRTIISSTKPWAVHW